MLNIIVPYSPRVLLIEIWSDCTQTHSYKGRCIKTEARLLKGRENICMWRYFLFILLFKDFNKTVHLDSKPILWSFSLGNRLTVDLKKKSHRCSLRFQVGQHISGGRSTVSAKAACKSVDVRMSTLTFLLFILHYITDNKNITLFCQSTCIFFVFSRCYCRYQLVKRCTFMENGQ